MTVDMIDLRDQAITQLKEVGSAIQHITLLEVGVVCVTIGVLLALRAVWLDWRKKKGYRMVLRDRNDKAYALLTDIIGDGLFEAEHAGKISNKEARLLYKEISDKLGLHDLVPKQHRLKNTAEELKRKRFGKMGIDYAAWKKSRMPQKFAEYIGSYKFRKSA
jgi:hypothetical protein